VKVGYNSLTFVLATTYAQLIIYLSFNKFGLQNYKVPNPWEDRMDGWMDPGSLFFGFFFFSLKFI
jgi:hypothetical protein